MKLLVISDIHQRHRIIDNVLKTVEFDRCVLTGDYFDDFNDTPFQAMETARWLVETVLPNEKIIPLIGNHDLNYFFRGQFICSGYSDAKADAISRILTREHVEKFKLFHFDENFLFTHAGLTVPFWKDMKQYSEKHDPSVESFDAYFQRIFKHFIALTERNVRRYAKAELLEAGYDRGGRQPNGGIVWVDFTNFASIKGINQFFGHTPHRVPHVHLQYEDGSYTKQDIVEYYKYKDQYDKGAVSINFDLDTHSNHYAIIENGNVEFYPIDPTAGGKSIRELMDTAWIPENPMSSVSGIPLESLKVFLKNLPIE